MGFDVKKFFKHKNEGKNCHTPKIKTLHLFKISSYLWDTLYKLTRLSTSSYFTVGSQILQVRLVMLETKGLEIFGHGICLLTETEECSDFNFCPAILWLEFSFNFVSKSCVFNKLPTIKKISSWVEHYVWFCSALKLEK